MGKLPHQVLVTIRAPIRPGRESDVATHLDSLRKSVVHNGSPFSEIDGVHSARVLIHFARWVLLDGGRRVLFASDYDGSQESYMDDFIDRLARGVNLVFSNGLGFPPTWWLILGVPVTSGTTSTISAVTSCRACGSPPTPTCRRATSTITAAPLSFCPACPRSVTSRRYRHQVPA